MSRWRPLVIDCEGSPMQAILHEPDVPTRTGILIVVGGPQYRVGSHRQFLFLGRHMSDASYPCLRFDCRGMGDSPGLFRGFERIEADIRAAVDAFLTHAPHVQRVVLWGLCDAASAALMYVRADRRIAGLVIANPWVRSPQSEARARVKHYYLKRLVDADFWKKVLRGGWNFRESVQDLSALRAVPPEPAAPAYVDSMLEGAESFTGPILLLVSGEDLTAAEFMDRVRGSKRWQAVLGRQQNRAVHLKDATHTFSTAAWRAAVERETIEWVGACNDGS